MNRVGTGTQNEHGRHEYREETNAIHDSMLAGSRIGPREGALGVPRLASSAAGT